MLLRVTLDDTGVANECCMNRCDQVAIRICMALSGVQQFLVTGLKLDSTVKSRIATLQIRLSPHMNLGC